MIPKFRGKSTAEENKGRWMYGNLVFDRGLAIIVSGIDEATCEYIAFEDFCSVDIETLGQSTGLFDKYGVEIFEGDVVQFEDCYIESDFLYINKGIVEWSQGRFTVTNRDSVEMEDLLDGELLDVTIIGSIYENPELMEGNA
ncbi:YopX family protein [Streptococcus constellatus]|uniref:YopX family protein n=1 Tax=Streptococcus constellatus TaxID=76860 RepID=UPI0020006FA0|nr:YopX family protein [Streptococcus constellatus]